MAAAAYNLKKLLKHAKPPIKSVANSKILSQSRQALEKMICGQVLRRFKHPEIMPAFGLYHFMAKTGTRING